MNIYDRVLSQNPSGLSFLIAAGEEPLRQIVTRKMRLERINQNLREIEQTRERDQCNECKEYDSFIFDFSRGDIICTACGTVSPKTFFADDSAHVDSDRPNPTSSAASPSRTAQSLSSPVYVRYFHFNEVLATLTLTGPWINNADFREIERALKESGKRKPTRGDIQGVCKHLNHKYKVQRFTKKYAEKWIQIVYRITGERPGELHPNLIRSLQRDFQIIASKWKEVEGLLNGSKKTQKRVQWPNYLETIYRLLKRRYPRALPAVKPWITRLSVKKRHELRIFFNKLFSLVGF